MVVSMSNEQRLKAEGMDKLLRKFNKYPDDKTFTVEEIIKASNEVFQEILEEDRRDMFIVYIKSAGGLKQEFTVFNTKEEAESFCVENSWEYEDVNGFVWDLDYEEVRR